jgi:hypothetical protein
VVDPADLAVEAVLWAPLKAPDNLKQIILFVKIEFLATEHCVIHES